MKLLVRYRAMLISTIVATTTSAWSFPNRARNISFTLVVFMSVVSLSFMNRQQITSVTTKIAATISATYRKPMMSFPPPSRPTAIMVIMEMIAAPTPAQVRPITDRFSRSFGVEVTAGIMLQ